MQDYCSYFPEGFTLGSLQWSWQHCCLAHDDAYTIQIDRKEADADLFKCVYTSSDAPVAALGFLVGGIMFIGVRAFGKRFYNRASK